MKAPSKSFLAHVLLLAIVLVWGSTFVLVKDALRDVSPLLFNLLRMIIALILLAVVYRKHIRTINRGILFRGSLVGFFLGLGYQFQTEGLKLTTPSKSAFITGLSVALVPLLLCARFLRREGEKVPGMGAFVGAAAALAGLAFLTLPAQISLASLTKDINPGDALTFAAAFFFALQIVALSKFAKIVRFEQMGLLQIASSTLLMACTGPVLEQAKLSWSPVLIAALAITAVLATAAAFPIQSFAQEILPATTIVLLLALEPVFAALTSYLVFAERLSMRQMFGAALVIAGILAAELLPKLSWAPQRTYIFEEE